MRFLIIPTFILFSLSAFADSEILFLNKALDFIDESGKSHRITPKKDLTLFKIIGTKGSVTEVELIQENGREKSKKLFVSTKWLKRGTKTHTLITDPNEVMKNVDETLNGNLDCDEPKEITEPIGSCESLTQTLSKTKLPSLENCLNSLLDKIPKSGSAQKRLSKLYDFSDAEQEFLAHVLTAYGEARGAKPTKAQLKGVMNVVENRVSYAQQTHPDANALDIVFQKSQFSMYNPKDGNWKAALKNANPEIMNLAIEAYIEMKTEESDVPSNVYHYMTTTLSKTGKVSWAKNSKKKRVQVDGSYLDNNSGHVYYRDIAWSFNPRNRYNK